jgi:PAS domain S-box-containing protein
LLAKLVFVLAACCLLSQSPAAGQVKPVRRVLVLTERNLSWPAVAAVDQEIRAGLEKSPFAIERYSEYTETVLFPREASYRKLREWYRNRKPDVIIAAGPSPIKFMAESHEKLFGDTPIVICGSSEEQADNPKLDSDFTGVWMTIDPAKTLDAGLQLQPSTQRVVVVGGVSSYDKHVEAIVREQLRSYESNFKFEYLTDLKMPALLERLRRLPGNTLVFYTSLTQDAAGTDFIPATESVPMVANAANAPVFVMADTLVGRGTLGGYMVSFAAQGKAAAEVAMRVLQGERPQDLPIFRGANVYIFDWRALRRWGFKESALPPGSIVLNRQSSVWESYRSYIIGGISLCLAETLLVLGLLWQRAKRRKVEAQLVITNDQLRSAMESGKAVGWEWDINSGRDWWFGDLKTMFGISSETHVGHVEDFHRYVHPEDRQQVSEIVDYARKNHTPYAAEFRVVWPDGTQRWVAAKGKFHYSRKGQPERMLGMTVDITERKRTEEALRESEERLRLAIQAGKMFAYEWDATTDVVVRSAESAQILGIDEATHLTGQQVLANVHPDDRERLKAAISELTAETPYLEINYRIARPDGTLLWVERNSRAHFDDHGRMLRIVGMVADVTERKRAEEALRESEERFRLVANTAPVMIWMSGPDKLCSYFNEPWLEFTGRPLERELGNGWAEGVHPEDFVTCLDTHVKAFDCREKFIMEYRLRRYDGEYRWVLDIGTPRFTEDGSFAGFIGSCVDFTDRRAAQQALRESEDKLRLLLDSTAEAIYGIDLEGRCTFCNPACLRALGYQRVDDLLGRNMHDLIHHSRADGTRLPAETGRIMRALQTGQGVHVDDEALWDAKGTSFPAEYWSYPQRKGQEVVGAVVTFLDITERKRTEVALANLSRRLIETQELERTRIARELHDDIGQRLALLAIELGQFDSPDLPAEVASRIGEIQKQSAEIATDVQSLSHELHSSKLEYLGIATAMRGFCKEFAAQQNVEIVFAHDAIPRTVPSDISLCLFRILQEALHNAVKYSGVRHFDAQLRASSDAIDLTVRDSGPGFDTEEAIKTSGLGLVSMAERIKLVGGQLSIESHPGSGTTIHASVPLRGAARAEP